MANLESLRSQGWHLTSEGLDRLCENEKIKDVKTITRKALDIDIKEYGAAVLTIEMNKPTFGPVVLQVAKIRNVSAPKNKPTSSGAPRMLKLVLTDGHTNCQSFEFRPLPFMDPDKIPPGTKLLIIGAQITSGSILLSPETCKLLGGVVPSLVEKWEVSKLMPNHIRVTEDGPPAWVNFGKKIITNLSNQSFKSLEGKNKDSSKENSEFQNQRQDAIAEATQGAVKKVFGGGVKPPQTFNVQEPRTTSNYHIKQDNKEPKPPRQTKQKGKDKTETEKLEKPSQRVSLFDFLEDKLSLTDTSQSKTTLSNSSNSKLGIDVPTSSASSNKYKQDFQDSPKNKFANKQKQFNKDINKFNRNPQNNFNSYNNRQDNYNNRQDTSRDNFNPRQTFEDKTPKLYGQDNRYQNDRPPRFQKQQKTDIANKFNYTPNNQPNNSLAEQRSKPNTNQFVDKLANEINNISLYNSKYETEKLHTNKQHNKYQMNQIKDPRIESGKAWKWKIGDRCMAKYWEDDKFYNAVVTGITNKTCMVEFLEYGNFEEVLHCDCIPISAEDPNQQIDRYNKGGNSQFTGSLEFRRGKPRPFIRTGKLYGQNRSNES